jgi:hypothetical protein
MDISLHTRAIAFAGAVLDGHCNSSLERSIADPPSLIPDF